MKITKEQGIKIKMAIRDLGYSITGFCRIHNISDRQFYTWLAGTNGYERNGIGKHFQEITEEALDMAVQITKKYRKAIRKNHEQEIADALLEDKAIAMQGRKS